MNRSEVWLVVDCPEPFLGSSMVEHPAVNRRVAGSSPARGAWEPSRKPESSRHPGPGSRADRVWKTGAGACRRPGGHVRAEWLRRPRSVTRQGVRPGRGEWEPRVRLHDRRQGRSRHSARDAWHGEARPSRPRSPGELVKKRSSVARSSPGPRCLVHVDSAAGAHPLGIRLAGGFRSRPGVTRRERPAPPGLLETQRALYAGSQQPYT